MAKPSYTLWFLITAIAVVISACQTPPKITSTNYTEIQTSTASPDVAETQPRTPSTTLIEAETKITAEDIPGTWVGKATWECPLDDPIWSATVEFKRDGSFAVIMSTPTLEEQVGSGVWSLSENDIEISFPTTIWAGTVTNGKMAGTLSSPEVDDCMGIWSLVKE